MRPALVFRFPAALALGLAIFGAPLEVWAQPGGAVRQPTDAPAKPQPAAPAVIVPPVVKKDEGAKYPKQALDDKVNERVEIILVLDVDAQGRVKNAAVETPVGHGFDEAAVEAARKIELDPATRNG